ADTFSTYLTAGIVLVGRAARLVRARTALPRVRATSLWVLALLGYCYLTALWSIFPSTTMTALNGAAPYLVTFVGLAPLLIKSSEDLRHCLIALMFSSMAALGLLLALGEWCARGGVTPDKASMWDRTA